MSLKRQSQPLRVECADYWSLITSRTINSRLWFVNNPKLENHCLTHLARYQEKYGVDLYSYCLMGNHHHEVALFPNLNRSHFYRDLNARIAEGVRHFVDGFEGGPVFERRYSEQALPLPQDVESYFLYSSLQAVEHGLSEFPDEYPGYNSFHDAINGRKRILRWVDWATYRDRKRFNKKLKPEDFTTEHVLEFKRLPGYEHLTQRQYKKLMLKKREELRVELVKERKAKGLGFLTREQLLNTVPGSLPKTTKKSKRDSKRPLVLTQCPEAKKRFLEWYFSIYQAYKVAVKLYRLGKLDVKFPAGTYRPPVFSPG